MNKTPMTAQGALRLVVALSSEAAEQNIRSALLDRYPRHLLGAIPFLISSELAEDADMARRTVTAVINSYLHPGMEHFLYGAENICKAQHLRRPLLIFRNDGDSARVAKTTAIKTWGSGPRGGLEGSLAYARHYDLDAVVAMDVGGTTTDISVVLDKTVKQLAYGEIRLKRMSKPRIGQFKASGVTPKRLVREVPMFEGAAVGQEVTVEVLDVDMDRERVSLSLKATQEDPWQTFARTHQIGQIVPGKVTKLVPFGAFVRVEEGIEGLVHISELAERHVEVPDQVVAVGDDAMVKVIDIDLERRRISLSLKQANEDYTEEFDPSKYGMADSYDEQGNYIFPEGFDAETNEWLEGFDKQRTEWEARYAEAERRHKMHTTQMEKFAAAEAAAAERPATNGSSSSSSSSRPEESAGGSLASDAQLAALREKLAGNA